MIDVNLKDGHGSGRTAKINEEGDLNVVVHPHPPLNEIYRQLPFRQYFTDNGTSTGTYDMRVNGSSTNVDYYISANETNDIFIKTIDIQISDNGAALNKFGALTALTNGLEFFYESNATGKIFIHEAIKDNLTFLRIGTGYATGTGSSAFRADISGGGGTDTYFMRLDLGETFGLIHGLRLQRGTNDRMSFTVKDNLSSGIDHFDIVAYGKKF